MASSARARGFSLLEILVVMGMFAVVVAFGLLISMESFRGSDFRSDRDLFVSLLQRARSQAMNNMCYGTCSDGRPHGVLIYGKQYILFQGTASTSRDTDIDAKYDASRTATRSGDSIVVFSQISGTTTGASFVFSSGGRSATVTVSPDGRIDY